MELRQLRSFVAVVEWGSFSRAAIDLGMTQQGLSQQIAQLEQELGAPLLTRGARGVTLLDTGRSLMEHARSMLRLADQVAAEIASLRSHPRGEVRVGVPVTALEMLAVPLLQEVERRMAGVSLRLVSGLSTHALQFVQSGWMDCAVVASAADISGLVMEPLIVEELYVVGPPGGGAGAETVPFREIAGIPLILPAHPNSLRATIDRLAEDAGWRPQLKNEIDGLPLIKALVKAGYAHTILTWAAMHEEWRRGELSVARIVDPTITRTLQLVTSAQRPVSRATAEVCAIIRRMVAELITSGRWRAALPAADPKSLTGHPGFL